MCLLGVWARRCAAGCVAVGRPDGVGGDVYSGRLLPPDWLQQLPWQVVSALTAPAHSEERDVCSRPWRQILCPCVNYLSVPVCTSLSGVQLVHAQAAQLVTQLCPS